VKVKIYAEEPNVKERLIQLNLTESDLQDAVKQGYIFRTKLTSNHPRIFYGSAPQAEIVASLREALLRLGWEKSNKDNYELVIDAIQNMSIAVATGDEFTGCQHATPSNKCPKKTNTIKAINTNNNLDLIDIFVDSMPVFPVNNDSFSTWLLLFHFAKNEIRCELSLPTEIGNDGRIKGWKERIILAPISLDEPPIEIRPIESQDIEIEIKRKVS
jgi:hypothetical protein